MSAGVSHLLSSGAADVSLLTIIIYLCTNTPRLPQESGILPGRVCWTERLVLVSWCRFSAGESWEDISFLVEAFICFTVTDSMTPSSTLKMICTTLSTWSKAKFPPGQTDRGSPSLFRGRIIVSV